MYDMGLLLLVKILTLIHQNELTAAAIPPLHSHFIPLVFCFIPFPILLCLLLPVSASSMTGGLAFCACPTTGTSDDFDERC